MKNLKKKLSVRVNKVSLFPIMGNSLNGFDFTSGAVGGTVGLLVSHPVDTIKTCVQSKTPLPTNLLGLYRGLAPPLIGMCLEKAIVFGTYGNARRNEFSVGVSGALAGLTAALIVTPYERLKIILQTGEKLKKAYFLPSSMWRGLSATFTREVPGFAIYFTTYEMAKDYFYPDGKITTSGSFLFGGLAGSSAWLFIYPQDVIKTTIQSKIEKSSFISVAKQIYGEAGFYGFFRGFHWALLRAFPLHAGTFMGVELMNKLRI